MTMLAACAEVRAGGGGTGECATSGMSIGEGERERWVRNGAPELAGEWSTAEMSIGRGGRAVGEWMAVEWVAFALRG
jgi:hypothetical protein